MSRRLLGGLSNDHFGQRLLGLLQKEGVDTGQLVIFDAPTTLAMVALGSDGAPVYSFRGDGCADRLLQPEQLRPLPDRVRGIHFGSYSLVASPIAETLLELLRREQAQRLISSTRTCGSTSSLILRWRGGSRPSPSRPI